MFWLCSIFLLSLPTTILSSYELIQDLPTSGITCTRKSIDMSNDNGIVAIGCREGKTLIYEKVGIYFSHMQTLIDNRGDSIDVDVTADGQWIMVIDVNGYVRIYTYNSNNHLFELFQAISYDSDYSYSDYAALTDDHLWLVHEKRSGNVYIHFYDGTSFTLHQTISLGSQITDVMIANDHQRLVVA